MRKFQLLKLMYKIKMKEFFFWDLLDNRITIDDKIALEPNFSFLSTGWAEFI
jgi:hypothetical protein